MTADTDSDLQPVGLPVAQPAAGVVPSHDGDDETLILRGGGEDHLQAATGEVGRHLIPDNPGRVAVVEEAVAQAAQRLYPLPVPVLPLQDGADLIKGNALHQARPAAVRAMALSVSISSEVR